MPEGDTIRRLADRISSRLAGQRCVSCTTRDPRLVGLDLTGATLSDADAVGKHLLLRFDDGRTVHAHLLMQGSFDVGGRSRESEWHRRLELEFEDGWLTAVDVPLLGVIPTREEATIVGHLGPDLCGPEPPDLDLVVANIAAAGREPLAGAMLDQRNVAGFGNIYAVEVPFIAGVSPWQPAGSVDGLGHLVAAGSALIRTNAERGPQNTTGRKLNTDDHWVYGKRRCPICGTRIERAGESRTPWQRVTYWCPACQPLDTERAVDVDRLERCLRLHPAARRR